MTCLLLNSVVEQGAAVKGHLQAEFGREERERV
jgi:hypothetical protein